MKKLMKYGLPAVAGALYAALAVLLSQLVPGLLAPLLEKIGPLAGLDDKTAAYAVQVLAPLKSADLLSPWLPFLTGGAVLGALTGLLFRRPARWIIVVLLICLLLLLIPLALLALWFTFVNGILVGNLIGTLLPLLPHLL